MATEGEFEPRLGRIRDKRSKRGRKYLHRVLAAANLARGGAGRSRAAVGSFDGSHVGRGAGVGRVLVARDSFAALRRRRVIVKTRIVKLAGKGAAGAVAYLRYVQRDSVTRDGGRGELYGAESDRADAREFLARGSGDRHQFRFIVSAEDGAEYEDLRPLTRRLMARAEDDLRTRLDWVAVDHFDTGHPHTHIIVRGKDHDGRDLVIARDYLTQGFRERAAELVDLDLGPRSEHDIRDRLRAEVDQERLTSIDRALLRDIGADGVVVATGRDAFDQTLRAGRLAKLTKLGLAEPAGQGRWHLSPGLADTLTRMGERGDIIRTMQRAFSAKGQVPALADQAIYDPRAPDARPLVGRLLSRGLSDELDDRHYLILEATDGRSHYVDIGKGENVPALGDQAIIRIEPVLAGVRDVDRTIVSVAAANGGRYDVDAHLRHDPGATEAFAETHVRRLEAMRRLIGSPEREADGGWIIPPDHLGRAVDYEALRARDRPVAVSILSAVPLEKLVGADAATWLDRELVSASPEPLRDTGFGHAVREASARRRQWLIAEGFAEEAEDRITYRAGMLRDLRRRELLRAAGGLSRELGIPFAETAEGDRVSGVYRGPVELASGRFAVVEKTKEFTLVPWRPVLDRQVGKSVAGVMRGGGISWTIGRQRGQGIS